MALRKRIATMAVAGAAVLAGTMAAAGPAAAIDRVDTATCNSRSDFFTVWNYPPKVCFAGNGYTGVALYDVYQVDTGNNSGGFGVLTQGGSQYDAGFAHWISVGFSPKVQLTYVNITGR